MSTLADLLRLVEANPRDERLLLKLAELHHKKGQLNLAAEAFRRAAELYAADGFFLKAIALGKQVLKLDPQLLDVHVRLADWLVAVGLMPESVGQLRMAEAAFLKAGRREEAAALRLRFLETEKSWAPDLAPPKARA